MAFGIDEKEIRYDDETGEPFVYRTRKGGYVYRWYFNRNKKDPYESRKPEFGYTEKNRQYKELGKKFRELREKMRKEYKGEDGTFNCDTLKPIDPTEGFQVSFEQSSDNYSDYEYGKIISEMSFDCDGNVYMGVFGGDPEISFYTKDLMVAKKYAKRYNQHSWYDYKHGLVRPNVDYDSSKNKVNY